MIRVSSSKRTLRCHEYIIMLAVWCTRKFTWGTGTIFTIERILKGKKNDLKLALLRGH